VPEIKCMEVSLKQDVLFLGGGVDDDSGVAKLAAITFEPESKLIKEQEIEPNSLSCIYSIKRLKEGNVLFLGGFGGVAVVFYEEGQFVHLYDIPDLLDDEICDLKFFEGSLYCISPANEEIASLKFPGYNFAIKATPRDRAPNALSTMFDLHIKNEFVLEDKTDSIRLSETGQLMYLGVEGVLKLAPKIEEGGGYNFKNVPSSRN